MKCPACGTENQSDYRFCIRCGEDLAKEAVPIEMAVSQAPAEAMVAAPPVVVEPVQPAQVAPLKILEVAPSASLPVSVAIPSPEPVAPIVHPAGGNMSFGQVKKSSLGVRAGSRMAIIPADKLAVIAAELEKSFPAQKLPDVRSGRAELVEAGESDILQGYMLQNFTGTSIFAFLRPFGTHALIGWHNYRKLSLNMVYLGAISAVTLVMAMISGFSGGYFSLFNVFTGFLIWGVAILLGTAIYGKIRYDNPWFLLTNTLSRADSDALLGMELMLERMFRQAAQQAGIEDIKFKLF